MFDTETTESNALVPAPAARQVATADDGARVHGSAMDVRELERFLIDMRNQPPWRREADREADFYDGNQLDQATLQRMEEIGIPPIVINLIKPTIDTVLGMEAKTRTDWAIRAETDADTDVAAALHEQFKGAARTTRAAKTCAEAYASQVKVGLGWVEVARETDPFLPPYRVQPVHRREIWWDWRAKRADLLDARYLVRSQWFDLDYLQVHFPKHRQTLASALNGWPEWDAGVEATLELARDYGIERDFSIDQSEWLDTERKRLKVYEVWYRRWVDGYVLKLPGGRVVEYDASNPRHVEAVAVGALTPQRARFSKVRLSFWVGPHRLFDVASPYQHNRFPYVPFWGYREDLTGVPYGLIRTMKMPQEEVNARRAKTLWLLSSRRVVVDDDAVDDHAETAREVARPDAYIITNPERKNANGFRVDSNADLSAQQFQIMESAKGDVQNASGIHQEALGKRGGAGQSGVAIVSLIEASATTLGGINDNYRDARRLVGELLLSLLVEDLAGQEVTVPVPVPGQRDVTREVTLNQRALDPFGRPYRNNDVTRVRAMVALEEVPSTPTYRHAFMQELLQLVGTLPPQVQMLVIDIVIEASDLPNKAEMAERLRSALKIGEEPAEDPAAEQQAQMQQQMAQLQMRQVMLAMQELQGKIERQAAETQLVLARVQKLTTVDVERDAAQAEKVRAETHELQRESERRDIEQVASLAERSQQLPMPMSMPPNEYLG